MREKRRGCADELKAGNWYWIQNYDCLICHTKYAVAFLLEDDVLPSVECDNCGWEMPKVAKP